MVESLPAKFSRGFSADLGVKPSEDERREKAKALHHALRWLIDVHQTDQDVPDALALTWEPSGQDERGDWQPGYWTLDG